MGQAVAALAPTIYAAAMTNPFLLVVFSLFCGTFLSFSSLSPLATLTRPPLTGVTVPAPSLPRFWRVWLYHLNPFTYLISGLVTNELHGLEIQCLDSEYSLIQPPSGQTCDDWLQPYLSVGGGYVLNGSASSDCQFCQYATGDGFYTPLGMNYDDRSKYAGWFFWYVVIFSLLVLFLDGFFLANGVQTARRRCTDSPLSFYDTATSSSTAFLPLLAPSSSLSATRSVETAVFYLRSLSPSLFHLLDRLPTLPYTLAYPPPQRSALQSLSRRPPRNLVRISSQPSFSLCVSSCNH
jgi:hypothetical protein